MFSAFKFLSQHWTEISGIAAAGVLFFDRLAKVTPTTKDDGAVSVAYKIFSILGVKVADNPGPGASKAAAKAAPEAYKD